MTKVTKVKAYNSIINWEEKSHEAKGDSIVLHGMDSFLDPIQLSSVQVKGVS